MIRWLKFNAVGALGFVVQLAVLSLLVSGFRVNYLLATALAVEIAVLHNFVWHELYTWRDRTMGAHGGAAGRLLRFNLTTGALSIAGNLLVMRLLVGKLGLHYLPANVATIAVLSLANFAASHWLVFRAPR
jgi:putative flippase GtrA